MVHGSALDLKPLSNDGQLRTFEYICGPYSEASVIAVNGDRDHPRKLKIREVAAPL